MYRVKVRTTDDSLMCVLGRERYSGPEEEDGEGELLGTVRVNRMRRMPCEDSQRDVTQRAILTIELLQILLMSQFYLPAY